MKEKIIQFLLATFCTFCSLHSEEKLEITSSSSQTEEEGLMINFQDVPMVEFLRFVSKIAEKNFIYDDKILDFKISLVTGKATSVEKILEIMVQLLNQQSIKVEEKEGYYLVEKMEKWELQNEKTLSLGQGQRKKSHLEQKEGIKTVQNKLYPFPSFPLCDSPKRGDFFIYKLQYHVGEEILSAIKNISHTLKNTPSTSTDLIQAIDSMQWVQSTNSVLYSGTEEGMESLTHLIQRLDVPKKQVFIEVLVIETDVRKGLEFGLEWGAGGNYRNRFGYGMGNFPKTATASPFAKVMQEINAVHTPTGADQIPMGRGFDLGVIGDIILHKGKSYFSIGSLVSALEANGGTTIVLNQKIITQDNKPSRIFVGDNIAFVGSKVETIGAAQQTSANIEYRDVGVKLNITPLLGEGDIITMDISEEITNVIPNIHSMGNSATGINTTKTDMATQVHVPDQSFLVLSGMVRNTKRNHKSGIPCLGGIPLIGAAFSQSTEQNEKRNVIVFVRPQIIHSAKEYQNITVFQENQFSEESTDPEAFQRGVEMLKKERSVYGKVDSEIKSPPLTTNAADLNAHLVYPHMIKKDQILKRLYPMNFEPLFGFYAA